ncbi:MAG: alpha/beta hydrolase [Candidatus Kapaibacterium sp.]|nr:MAG: alpha/beta hydrolase [Candidatus Kapabacteria bacterium]
MLTDITLQIDRAFSFAAACVVPSGFLPPPKNTATEFAAMDYGYPTHYVELPNGVRLAYLDVGEGAETIIFIHGLASYLQAWSRNLPELSKKYRCIAIDLPGYGKSSKHHEITLDFYASTIKHLCDSLGLANVTLCGHSLGGQTAILTGLRYNKLVKNLILLSSAGLEFYTDIERTLLAPFAKLPIPFFKYASPATVYMGYVANFFAMPPEAMFMVKDRIGWAHAAEYDQYCRAVLESFLAMANAQVYPRLPNVKQRTLIVYGKYDNFIPNWFMHGGSVQDIAHKSANRIPNAEYLIFDQCGHFVPFEKPQETNAAITRFLDKADTKK